MHALELWNAALAADDAFQTACIKQFGKSACDKRYQPKLFNSETRAASEAFRRATAAWLSTLNPHDISENDYTD